MNQQERLKLKDIELGNIDAKNEVLSNTPEEISRFLASFVSPPSLNVERFYDRRKYYIVGLKGTGKTALLRYVSLKLDEDADSMSSFVLFKSEVDEDLRKDFAKAARVQIVSENSSEYDDDDYEAVWRWFIYRKIAAVIQEGLVTPFQENANLNTFVALVNSESPNKPEQAGIMRLVPNIRRGNIEISQSPKLGLEFDWDENGKAKVNFNEIVRQADQAFATLSPDLGRLNIFFDELELNHNNSKQYQRDARLVRDLIVSVERINAIAKQKGYKVCLYAAIRSEVQTAVAALGKEINKPLTDFGSVIMWNRPGIDAEQQPLLHVVSQRINSARAEKGISVLSSAEIWQEYFPSRIDMKSPQKYVLHNSWYRPRDIIRLLITVQDQYPDQENFTIQALEAVRKSYSTASWIELTEELKTRYKPSEIEGIKYIFYGYRQVSSVADLIEHAGEVAKDHVETSKLLERVSVRDVLKDLFRVGVIGNSDPKDGKKKRFCFRGDDEILFVQNVFLHNALRAHLSAF